MKFPVYVVVVYLAVCAFCYSSAKCQTVNTRLGDTEEKKVDRMWMEIVSCEVLADYADRMAYEVIRVEAEYAKRAQCVNRGKVEPICIAYTQLRADYMQALTDAEDAGNRRCGWERN